MIGRDEEVWEAVRSIPRGEARTYGEIAELLGGHRRNDGQAVGQALKRGLGKGSDFIPWWRVVKSDGSMRTPGDQDQTRRLRAEGVEITSDGRVASLSGARRATTPPRDGRSHRTDLTARIHALQSRLQEYGGALCEAKLHAGRNPNTAGMVLRQALEQLLRRITCGGPSETLHSLIQRLADKAPRRVIRHAHSVRLVGRDAAHYKDATAADIREALDAALTVGEWAASRTEGNR